MQKYSRHQEFVAYISVRSKTRSRRGFNKPWLGPKIHILFYQSNKLSTIPQN